MDPSRIAEVVAALEHAGHSPRRVRLPLNEYRPLLVHEDLEKALVTDVDKPRTAIREVEVVADPDLDDGEGYVEVPLSGDTVERKASVAPTPPPADPDEDSGTDP